MRFRREIQGLRGIAILGVLFYHANVGPLMGGFVGVDVFFVISGFLIFGVIHRDLLEKKFSLATFYTRRIRRLYPAFLVVLLLVLAVAYYMFYPGDFSPFYHSLRRSLLQQANLYFLNHTGYFDIETRFMPLLHLWSIAVEWQFYLVFPIIVAVLYRLGVSRWVKAVVYGLCLASFAASFYVFRNQMLVFYTFPFRVWEMLLGASLVFVDVGGVKSRIANAAFGIGCLLVVVPMVLYGYIDRLPFPGPTALPPCLGCALVILFFDKCSWRFKEVFGGRFLVFVGEISYSLYLLHWPALVFYRYYADASLRPITLAGNLAALAVACIMAIAMYYLVENPGRRLRIKFAPALLGSVACSLLLLILCRQGNLNFKEMLEKDPALSRDEGYLRAPLIAMPATGLHGEPAQVDILALGDFREDPDEIDFVVLGDSHTNMWGKTLEGIARRKNLRGLSIFNGNILLGIYRRQDGTREDAFKVQDALRKAISRYKIKRIILSSAWSGYYRKDQGAFASFPVDDTLQFADKLDMFRKAMRNTLDEFARLGVKRVYCTIPAPGQGFDPPRVDYLFKKFGVAANVFERSMPVRDHEAACAETVAMLREFFPEKRLIDVPEALRKLNPDCDVFPYKMNGRFLFSDPGHITFTATELIRDVMEDALTSPLE